MFTENVKRRDGRRLGDGSGRGGRERLYATAIELIAARGYEATTLRDIAKQAGVSVGLLYRYFPGKQAVVIALYDELSSEFARQVADMPPGRWRDRFVFALKTSLAVLEPHRVALRALTPILVGDPEEGIFAASTAFSRLRVQQVFEHAVTDATDAPKATAVRSTRPAAIPRPSGRALVVAARQERTPARDADTGLADATTSPDGRPGASRSPGSKISDVGRRARSRWALWQSRCRVRVDACSWHDVRLSTHQSVPPRFS